MALKAITGFDHAFSQSQLGAGRFFRLLNPDVLTSISTTGGRFGGRAVSITEHNNAASKGLGVVLDSPISVSNVAVAGFAIRIDNAPDQEIIAGFTQAGFQKIGIGVNSGGFWTIRNVETPALLATSPTRFAVVGRWYYVEIEFYANSSSGYLNLFVNGELVLTYSGNTDNGLGDIGEIFFGSTTGSGGSNIIDHTVDDVYVLDNTGSVNNARLGDCRVEILRPSSTIENDFSIVGTVPAATAHESVDDASGVDSDVTAIESATSTNRAIFAASAGLSEAPRAIHGVSILHVTRKDGAGSPTIKGVVVSNAVEAAGSAEPTLDGYTTDTYLVELDPDGSIPWTRAKVEAAHFGVEIG